MFARRVTEVLLRPRKIAHNRFEIIFQLFQIIMFEARYYVCTGKQRRRPAYVFWFRRTV